MRLPTVDRQARRTPVVFLLFVGLVSLSIIHRPAPAEDKEPGGPSDAERASHLETMRKIAQSLKLSEFSDGNWSALRLADKPVLRYGDNTRRSPDSTLWLWTSGGLPGALVGVEHYPDRAREQWLFEVVSLSAERIAVARGEKTLWTARRGLQLRPLADAPQPAGKPAARLAQMKQIARRFTAHERAVVEGRIELRPLAQPLYRYESEASRTTDGAIFSFANGTNPEVLLVLETERSSGQEDASGWRFAFAQIAGAEVFAKLDGEQIWQCPEADPPAERDSYFNGWLAPEAVK